VSSRRSPAELFRVGDDDDDGQSRPADAVVREDDERALGDRHAIGDGERTT
jgi:hypothetical protein